MTQSLPPPLVPPEVTLRGMPYMPMHGDRLFKSTTWIEASSDAKVAALRLWWHAFAHEEPAASLPDNDQLLAEHSGLGTAVRAWRKVKAQAMRGWIKCSDGRWYHPVVAEFALEAWSARVRNREKVRKFREKKEGANRAVLDVVTVTEPVTQPSRTPPKGESESEGKGKLQGKGDSDLPPAGATTVPPEAPPTAATPRGADAPASDTTDHLAIPEFLRRGSARIAQSISPDWLPSQSAQDQLAKSRPDLTTEIVQRRMVEFRNWCAEKGTQTHNADATWFSFMVKTHDQRPGSAGHGPRGAAAAAQGIDEA